MEATAEEVQVAKYPAYKDSGVEWLGEIPAHWEAVSLGSLLELKSDKNHPDYEVLSVYREYGVILKDSRDDNHNATSLDTTNYKAVEPGDLVVNKMKAWQGSMGISVHKGIVSPAYITCKVTSKKVYSEYLHQLLRSNSYIGEYNRISYGVRIGQWDMHYEDFKKVITLLPPKEEQTAIAQFLDRKTAQIEKAIGIKEKQIELLKERRQVLIHNAVTRGLNPNAPMEDSGVEWIGEIPAHWETKRVKNVFRLIIDPAPINNKCELLSIYTDIGVKPRKELEQKGNRASTTDGYWFVKKGDFIVNKLLAWMGAIGLSEYEGVTSPAYDILRPTLKIKGEYYHELFRTKLCSSELKKHSRGIMDMRLRLYFDKFGAIRVPFPPYEEQVQISEYIVSVSNKIESAVAFKEQEIEKLKEYKASLINSAITGKIKVC